MMDLFLKTYKPNNERANLNVLYRGAIEWNKIPAISHNNIMTVEDFR